jgi:hypothetical protein
VLEAVEVAEHGLQLILESPGLVGRQIVALHGGAAQFLVQNWR